MIAPPGALAPYVIPNGPSTAGIPAITLHPTQSGTLFIGTVNRGIFKSSDCGATWTHMNNGTNGAQLDSGGVNVLIDPDHPDTMYATIGYGSLSLWKSTNGGVDWIENSGSKAFDYRFVESLAMDPNDPLHLVLSPHAKCLSPQPPACMGESTDGGATWRYFAAPAWIEGSFIRIFGRKTWVMPSAFSSNVQITLDAGATWNAVDVSHAATALAAYYLPSPFGVITSADGIAWSPLANSPHVPNAVLSDTKLFACDQWTPQCLSAPKNDPTSWSALVAPTELVAAKAGLTSMVYDAGHKLLYVSTIDGSAPGFSGGLWRTVPN